MRIVNRNRSVAEIGCQDAAISGCRLSSAEFGWKTIEDYQRYRATGHVARMSDSQDTFRALHSTYVDPRPTQGLEMPPMTSTSHLASDPKCRPPSAQPRTQLSMVTCPGQRTVEVARGNGYAPARGSLVMMMMMIRRQAS